jgi:general secretion pathway protein A
MHDDQGREFHAALIALKDDAATFSLGTETRTVAVGALAAQWSGGYTLLWRVPPGVREPIRPGDRGPAVAWLIGQLAQEPGRSAETGNNPLFDEVLVRQVKQFQLAQGLIPDGSVGLQTLMRLAGAADQTAPALSSGRNGE